MKHYTFGFILLFFSFFGILILLYFGGLTRKIEKEIDIIQFEISNLNEKILVNELEFVAHTSPNYLIKLEKLYLINNYDEDKELNIIDIEDFKIQSIHKIYRVKGN
jgi:hypothetical protein